MTVSINISHLAYVFGILGDTVSFMVYLAPVPTFYKIWKMKSTEGFHAIPYLVSLFSAMLTLYYGLLKLNVILIIINSVGCVIESTYILMFLIYASRKVRIYNVKILLCFNVGVYGLMILSTVFIPTASHKRVHAVGWICAVFSVCVFASPLSIMRQVIRTKSVKYMPFLLSFFLTISSVMWFLYGFLINDFFVASPNIMGFLFGMAQMILYFIYMNSGQDVSPESDLHVIGPPSGIVQAKTNDNTVIMERDNNANGVPMV